LNAVAVAGVMNVIVVGYGRVGIRTAAILRAEGHDVVVVDNDPEKVERAREDGFRVVEGEGAREEVLVESGIETADAVGGLTGDVDDNHAVCLIGREYGCRTAMRINEDVSGAVYGRYVDDADEVVYPERFGAAGAKTALLGGNFNAIGELTEGLQLLTVRLPEGSPVVGEQVNAIDLGDRGRIYAHGRDGEPLTIPLPGTLLEAEDRLALIARSDAITEVRSELLGE